MAIHHAHKKQAADMGITLEEVDDVVRAFHPSTATEWYATDGKTAIKQGYAILNMAEKMPDLRYTVEGRAFAGRLRDINSGFLSVAIASPQQLFEHAVEGNIEWSTGESPVTVDKIEDTLDVVSNKDENGDPTPHEVDAKVPVEIQRNDKGVPLDGAVAYKEGFSAADCPFTSETEDDKEYENYENWNNAWDEAADAATEEDEDKHTGSVVKDTYRARYAELGHPTHCGDWLANILNNLVQGKKATDLARFETICEANGVDLSKYNRDTPGWQGRLRMTGRNLLAKKVYLAGGVLKTPVEGADPEYRAPADWMAGQRFKMPKAEQGKPVPTAE